MLPSPQLRAAMNIATKFLAPDATVEEKERGFQVDNLEVDPMTPAFCTVPYRSLYEALDKGYTQFVEHLKAVYKTVGWL